MEMDELLVVRLQQMQRKGSIDIAMLERAVDPCDEHSLDPQTNSTDIV